MHALSKTPAKYSYNIFNFPWKSSKQNNDSHIKLRKSYFMRVIFMQIKHIYAEAKPFLPHRRHHRKGTVPKTSKSNHPNRNAPFRSTSIRHRREGSILF